MVASVASKISEATFPFQPLQITNDVQMFLPRDLWCWYEKRSQFSTPKVMRRKWRVSHCLFVLVRFYRFCSRFSVSQFSRPPPRGLEASILESSEVSCLERSAAFSRFSIQRTFSPLEAFISVDCTLPQQWPKKVRGRAKNISAKIDGAYYEMLKF